MASPMVAGAAALLRSYGVAPANIRSRLVNSARPPKSGGMDPIKYGAGILDVQAALINTTLKIVTPAKGSTVSETPEFQIAIQGLDISSIKVYVDYADLNGDGIPDSPTEIPVISGLNISDVSERYSDCHHIHTSYSRR